MSAPTFSAHIDGKDIHCQITPDRGIPAPVFCFSLMAPPTVTSGGTLLKADGSYGEVQLPDLTAGTPHAFTLCYAEARFRPVNRAWLPLGAYLRTATGIINLPPLPAGVAERPAPPAPKPQGLGLLPPPKSWHPAEGTLSTPAITPQPGLWDSVEALAARCNLPPLQTPDGTLATATQNDAMKDNEYRITIHNTAIDITYKDAASAHYAGITLLVLRQIHGGHLPCGTLTDAPRFEWRGQHLDCARHFYAPGTITRLLDVMALLKMNRFHWHFSDDEAFRLELTCLPELAQKTGTRGEGELIPGVFGGGARAGGTYSHEDVHSIVAHAQSLFIETLPEIEFPAHALGFARALPQTRDPDDRGLEKSVQGYAGNVLNPAMPETWRVIEAVAREVSALFPFGHLHLGADELPNGTWDGSPAVDQLKADNGLTTADDVLGWSLSKLAGTLATQGIRCAAWEEAARGQNGGIGHNALLFSWTGQNAGIDAAKAGYDIVMSPAQHVYLDMAHTDNPEDWGAAWAAFVSLTDTIDWTVVPEQDIEDRVIGVEGTFWSEFTTKDNQMEPMIAPRIFGVAAKGWASDEPLETQQFARDAHRFCDILTHMGWRWNAACFEG